MVLRVAMIGFNSTVVKLFILYTWMPLFITQHHARTDYEVKIQYHVKIHITSSFFFFK